MNNEQTWCKEVDDMRAAIESVNDCMCNYAWTMQDEQAERVGEAMKQLKKSYKALKLFNRGFNEE